MHVYDVVQKKKKKHTIYVCLGLFLSWAAAGRRIQLGDASTRLAVSQCVCVCVLVAWRG